LLLRSAEAKPRFFLSVPETPHLSSSIGFRRGFQCLKTSLSSRFWVFFRSRKGPCSLITFKLFRRLGPFLFANFSEIFWKPPSQLRSHLGYPGQQALVTTVRLHRNHIWITLFNRVISACGRHWGIIPRRDYPAQ